MKELRILIADDHEVVRCGIRTILERQPDWRVCGEAATAGEAIEKTKRLRPHVVLLDVTLPDMETSEVIPEVMQVRPTVKIVAVAVDDAADLAAKALAAGASGLALKSDQASEIVLTVKNIAEGKPFLSAGAVGIVRSQLAAITVSAPAPTDLTPRELGILKLLAGGRTNKQVATVLGLSVKTVDTHRSNIMRKLKLRTYSELVRFAVRHNIIGG